MQWRNGYDKDFKMELQRKSDEELVEIARDHNIADFEQLLQKRKKLERAILAGERTLSACVSRWICLECSIISPCSQKRYRSEENDAIA